MADPEGTFATTGHPAELVDMAMEICDGTADFVTSEVDSFVDDVGRSCPWSAQPVAISG